MTTETKNAAAASAMIEEREFLTRLFEAALAGKNKQVQALVETYSVEHSVPPEQVLLRSKDGQGRTALHFACQSTPEAEHGLEPSSLSSHEHSDDQDIVSFLLAWLVSLHKGETEAAIGLLEMKDKEGLTPLMLASQVSNGALAEKRVDCMLTAGGEDNKFALARSKAGATALHYAAAANETTPATILRLYDAGKVALETNSLQGGTPLHWVASIPPPANRSLVLQTLVQDCGANVNANNNKGFTPLVMAAAAANDVHSQYLVQSANADWTMQLSGEVTLFHIVAELNLSRTLTDLLAQDGASEFCQRANANGRTPLDLALQQGNLECVMLLSDDETDEAAARARIDEVRQTSGSSSLSETVSPATAQAADTITSEEQEVMELLARIVNLEISNDAIQQSLELKRQGNDYFKQKDWAESLECYIKAIQLNPADTTFYSNRSACHMELGQPALALKDALVARKLKPTWSKACYRMAVARLELGRYEDAAVAAYEGLQQDDANVELQRLFRTCVERGQAEFKASQEQIEEALQQESVKDAVS